MGKDKPYDKKGFCIAFLSEEDTCINILQIVNL